MQLFKIKNRLKLINIILTLVYLLVVSLMLVFQTNQRRAELIDSIDRRLFDAASVVSYMLKEDFHDRAVAPGAIGLDEERMNRQRFNDFSSSNGFEWVYTVIEWGGNYYFTAPTVTELELMERPSWYFYPYDDIPPEFIGALRDGEPVSLTYDDVWGVHRSVAVRELSPSGNPYIVCIDYNISAVDSIVYRGVLASAFRFALAALVVIPFLFLNIIYNIRISRLNGELTEYRFSLEKLVDVRTRELEKTRDALKEQAIRDALTGTYNRRYMLERLDEEIGRHRRSGKSITLMMVDLDHFKQVNDNHGHAAGDETLKRITAAVTDDLREHDVFGRYGGDEFLIILPDTDLSSGKAVADKLLDVVSSLGEDGAGVTLSIGLAESVEGENSSRLLARADENMYEAKKTRNTLCC